MNFSLEDSMIILFHIKFLVIACAFKKFRVKRFHFELFATKH